MAAGHPLPPPHLEDVDSLPSSPSIGSDLVVGSHTISLQNLKSFIKPLNVQNSVVGMNLSTFRHQSSSLPPTTYRHGKPSVIFKKSDKLKLITGLKHLLIAKFSHGRPAMAVLKQFLVNRRLIGSFNVSLFDSKHVIIECESFDDFVHIWLKQTLVIQGFTARIFKWTESFHPTKESTIFPVWFHLPGLPIFLYEEGALLLIAKAIGNPLHIDSNNLNRSKLSYASICVEYDVLKDPIHDIWIAFEDGNQIGKVDGFLQQVVYDKVPSFCNLCHHLGHNRAACKRPGEITKGIKSGVTAEPVSLLDIESGIENITEAGLVEQKGEHVEAKDQQLARGNQLQNSVVQGTYGSGSDQQSHTSNNKLKHLESMLLNSIVQITKVGTVPNLVDGSVQATNEMIERRQVQGKDCRLEGDFEDQKQEVNANASPPPPTNLVQKADLLQLEDDRKARAEQGLTLGEQNTTAKFTQTTDRTVATEESQKRVKHGSIGRLEDDNLLQEEVQTVSQERQQPFAHIRHDKDLNKHAELQDTKVNASTQSWADLVEEEHEQQLEAGAEPATGDVSVFSGAELLTTMNSFAVLNEMPIETMEEGEIAEDHVCATPTKTVVNVPDSDSDSDGDAMSEETSVSAKNEDVQGTLEEGTQQLEVTSWGQERQQPCAPAGFSADLAITADCISYAGSEHERHTETAENELVEAKKGMKQLDGMLVNSLVQGASNSVGNERLICTSTKEEPPAMSVPIDVKPPVAADSNGLQQVFERIARLKNGVYGMPRSSAITPRKLSGAAAEFTPKWAVLVEELVEEKKQSEPVSVEKDSWAVFVEKEEKQAEKYGSPILSDDMGDTICAFKCKSVPNSPSRSRKNFDPLFYSPEYSPASKAVLKKYGADTSNYFEDRWSDYD